MRSLAGESVLLGPSTFGEVDSRSRSLLVEAGLDVIGNPFRRKLTREELGELLGPNVQGLVAGLEPLDRDVLERSSLRVISRCGAGLSNVDLEAAKELGILVRSTPDGPTNAVAELTITAMLNLVRAFPTMNREMHSGQWSKVVSAEIKGKTVVIVGFGHIGRRVAALVTALGATPVAVDPAIGDNSGDVRVCSLTEALPLADICSLHVSGSAEVLGSAELGLLKNGAFVLNSSRGGVINEQALKAALDDDTVAGAWLDCFTEEPYRGEFIGDHRVLLTPHAGSYTRECRVYMESLASQNLLDAMRED